MQIDHLDKYDVASDKIIVSVTSLLDSIKFYRRQLDSYYDKLYKLVVGNMLSERTIKLYNMRLDRHKLQASDFKMHYYDLVQELPRDKKDEDIISLMKKISDYKIKLSNDIGKVWYYCTEHVVYKFLKYDKN